MIAAELCLLADPAFKITALKNVEALNYICLIWNILFMAPRIKMIVIKTYFGAVVVKPV